MNPDITGEIVDVTATCVVRSQESKEFMSDTVDVTVTERHMGCVRETYTEDLAAHDELDTIRYTAPVWDDHSKLNKGGS